MVKCCNIYKHMFIYIKYAIYLLSRAAEMADLLTRAQEGRKEMLYLTTHSTHFIYSYIASDHLDSERGILLLPLHDLLFQISSKVFYMHHPSQDYSYHGLLHQSWSTGWNEK